MDLRPIKLTLPVRLENQFKKQAKAAFPNETLAYVIGKRTASRVFKIKDLYTPQDMDSRCTHDMVSPKRSWLTDAEAYAADKGLEVIGDIHSHPYAWKEWKDLGHLPDRRMSECDQEGIYGRAGVYGICLVAEHKDKKLRASVKFWAPPIEVLTKKERG